MVSQSVHNSVQGNVHGSCRFSSSTFQFTQGNVTCTTVVHPFVP